MQVTFGIERIIIIQVDANRWTLALLPCQTEQLQRGRHVHVLALFPASISFLIFNLFLIIDFDGADHHEYTSLMPANTP